MVLTLYKYHIEYSIWQQALHCRLWNIFFWEGGTNFFILLERYWDSSHEAQGKYHPWPSVKEGGDFKARRRRRGSKRQNQVGGLMKCHAPIISWVSLLPASHCVSFCQYHTWDPYFLSKSYTSCRKTMQNSIPAPHVDFHNKQFDCS